jgi:hypothetical protein
METVGIWWQVFTVEDVRWRLWVSDGRIFTVEDKVCVLNFCLLTFLD